MLHFDSVNGVLHCQSGVTLEDVIRTFHPKGWFLHVTPGTRLATIGGCIACDAHGKNWKAGSFSSFVRGLHLMLHDGSIIWCDHKLNSDIYYATFGGMGLTGVILDVEFQLKKISSSFVDVETIRFRNIRECFDLLVEAMGSYEFLFSWLDSHKEGKDMGRGILQLANYRANENMVYRERSRIPVPFYLPNCAVNRYSVCFFNSMYYAKSYKNSKTKVYLMDFCYPLDGIADWYRIYGKKGFIEYQAVIPFDRAYETISELIRVITKSKQASIIAAVKPLTKSTGLLSFPMDGFTLAVDFLHSQKLWELLDKLDDIVIENGGRVYLAKDARLSANNFKKMYLDSLKMLESIREKYHIGDKFTSLMSNRLKL